MLFSYFIISHIFSSLITDVIVYNPHSVSVGEHDMIGDRKGLPGKSSLEINLRTNQKWHCVQTVRKQVRAEAYHGTSKKFWKTAIENGLL